MNPTPGASGDRDLRVAFDYTIFNLQKIGGISRYLARIAEYLPTFGVTPKIISPLYVSDYLRDMPKGMVWGRHVARSERQRLLGEQLGERLYKPLAALFGAQVMHESYYNAHRLGPVKCPVVLTVHDMIFELNPDIADAQWWIQKKRGAIRRADKIICISESTKRDLLRFFPEVEERVKIVLHGFDPVFENKADNSPLHDRPYIVYVGMRRDYKNFDGLLNAFSKSKRLYTNFDLICIGGGAFTAGEARNIEELGLAGRVMQRDADDAALSRWYQHAAVFAYPSLYEGFGIPPLEAMAADCPVVCINISSMPEVCGDAAEYADPGAPDPLMVALENVVLSTDRADVLRYLGRERVQRFSWGDCARRTSDVYKSLV